jgi:hypothetical protein
LYIETTECFARQTPPDIWAVEAVLKWKPAKNKTRESLHGEIKYKAIQKGKVQPTIC